MNYLRNLKAKAKAQSSVLPSLTDLLGDNDKVLTETEITSRLTTLKDILMFSTTNEKLNELVDNLTIISHNLPLILIKWRRSTQFGQILYILPWRNFIFTDTNGIPIVSILLDILSDMITISPIFIQSIIKNIVLKIFQGEDKEGSQLSYNESQIFQRCHIFLKELVETYPSASLLISNTFKTSFPHYITSTVHCYVAYLTNVIDSIDYLSDTQSILNLIIDKLIWLEMSSQRAAESLAIDGTTDSGTTTTTTTTTMSTTNDNNNANIELAIKCYNIFDTGFDLLLSKLNSILHPDSLTYDSSKAEVTIGSLLYIFTTQVINIDSLINLPFAMVYWSSFSEDLCERTLSKLWYETIKSSEKGSLDSRSVCILASMMVESNYITTDQVVSFLENAVNWSLDYSDCNNDITIDLNYNPDQHKLFYSVTQSIFYLISCKISEFNMIQLKSLRLLNLQGLIGTKLNPLLYCLPTIVEQFVEISRDYQIALCSHVIDKNIRLGLDVSSFFNHSLCYYFPFNSFTFQLASPKFDSILCY
ncbi:RNA polymerase I-specific transcription initiation factor RRN3-like [Panonychus citri]|uniref:RNA polymerase I-specific transcription initiation factor RRN3-like n=1 Tax=Panonychus citri TaxID=50023 RepID=UPI002307A600|nr:RNA polymerase I-specific transcription initiation factor RRN3-like [Panonychus citri]